MKTFKFKKLLQQNGWISNALVTTDTNGKITEIKPNAHDGKENDFYALPGFQNAHSHGFQYAMAGLAEKHQYGNDSDDFWGWREAMYNLALQVSPDDMTNIAAQLYSEMLKNGFTHVAEFHYLHHDQNGKPYDNLAEMGSSMIRGAQIAGINITLVPIFYQKGGFGSAPNERQRRFISKNIDDYVKLLEASKKACFEYDGANVGIGIHSLRGVCGADIIATAQYNERNKLPFHIHIAEQLKEIEDCLAFTGQRPVDWLCDHVNLDEHFHLVHATHLTGLETKKIADSGANVVLCPTTEGNLGDGIFPLRKFQEMNGKWSIGTDSHIGLNPFEELRLLDYGQRLISHKRNSFTSPSQEDSGNFAIDMSLLAGRKAMGNFESAYFKPGDRLNALLMDGSHPLIANTSEQNLLSTMVYGSDTSWNAGTICNAKLVVSKATHVNKESVQLDFAKTINRLKNR